MKYAVVRIKGKQFKVFEGDNFLIDKVEGKLEPEVLLYVDGDKIQIGDPLVKGVKVDIKVDGNEKGEKIDVLKYKAKSRYRKHIGFRPNYSRIKIQKISEV